MHGGETCYINVYFVLKAGDDNNKCISSRKLLLWVRFYGFISVFTWSRAHLCSGLTQAASPWLASLPRAWLHIRVHWSLFVSFTEVFLGSCALMVMMVVQRRDRDSAEAVNDYIMSQKWGWLEADLADLFSKVWEPDTKAKCEMNWSYRSLYQQSLGKRQEYTLDKSPVHHRTHTHTRTHTASSQALGFNHKDQKLIHSIKSSSCLFICEKIVFSGHIW